MSALEAAELRRIAAAALELHASDSDVVALAHGVLSLLEQRDTGRRLAEDRFDAEMAELRDEIHTVARQVASLAALREVALSVGMLSKRVDGVADRVESHGELLGQHSYTLATHSMRLSGLGSAPHA